MQYLVTFCDGSQVVLSQENLAALGSYCSYSPYDPICCIVSVVEYMPPSPPTPPTPPPAVTYGTDIVAITAPSSALAGDTVIVDVSVKNVGSVDENIAVTGVYDSTSLSWQFDYLLVSPGQTVVMRGWFTMPSKKVRVTVYSKYWDGSKWVQDDSGYVDISLVESAFSEFAIVSFSKV